MRETDQPHPAYAYGIAKLQAEQGLLSLVNASFSVYCLRKGTVCGISVRPRLDIVLNTMVRDAITLGKVTVFDPTEQRPIISVADAAWVYAQIILNPDFPSGIYNAAEGNYTVEELGRAVVSACARQGLQVELQIGSSTSPRSYKADLSKLSHYMHGVHWQTPDQIADELLQHLLDKSRDYFLDPRFYNIQMFKRLFSDDGNYNALAGWMRATDDGGTSTR
jgi:nucleoside-diphosphate-sugar epimerase